MTRYGVATPHLIEGTDVLKNKAGLTNATELDAFEKHCFMARLKSVPEGDLSTDHLKKIHKHLLQDVYEWAGEFRNVPLAKGKSRFCQPQFVKQQVDQITKGVDVENIREMNAKDFATELAEVVGELNAVHPFLDGNGRIIRVYAQQVARAAGYDLEVHKLKRQDWNKASEQSCLTADNRRLADLLSVILKLDKQG